MTTNCQDAPPIGQIFVIGTARSGTTWISNLLEGHPAIAAVTAPEHQGIHESHLYSHTRYCFPKRLSLGEFVQRYQDEDYFRLLEVDPAILQGRAEDRGTVAEHFRTLMDAYAVRLGARFWLEKTPKHCLYVHEISREFPGAYYVLIERDFRKVLLSHLNKYARPGAPRWLQIGEKILRYVSDTRAVKHWRRSTAAKVIAVRYEALVADREREVGRILDFLGLDRVELNSRFPPDSSFSSGQRPAFSFSLLQWRIVELARAAAVFVPLTVMRRVRVRRDRRQARTFPKYQKVCGQAVVRRT